MPDSSSTILGIDHIQITIPTGDEATARAFYCGLLGLAEVAKPDALVDRGGFWLNVGGMPLHVGTEPDWDRTQTKAHIAFRVSDLAHWRDRLTAAGCVLLDAIAIPGFYRFETRDPFGNRIEFIQPSLDNLKGGLENPPYDLEQSS